MLPIQKQVLPWRDFYKITATVQGRQADLARPALPDGEHVYRSWLGDILVTQQGLYRTDIHSAPNCSNSVQSVLNSAFYVKHLASVPAIFSLTYPPPHSKY